MKKILLAENDPFLINVYAGQLRKSGYSASIAIDGEIIINRIKDINPDLLVLDANLPGPGGIQDGLSVLKILREDTNFKELKVVLLSDFFQKESSDHGNELGVIRCFSKTENTSEEIVAGIKTILS